MRRPASLIEDDFGPRDRMDNDGDKERLPPSETAEERWERERDEWLFGR